MNARDFANDVLGLVAKYKAEKGYTMTQLAVRLVVSGLTLLKLAGYSKEQIREEVNNSLDRNWDKLKFGNTMEDG